MKSLVKATRPLQHINMLRHILTDDGTFPNNGLLITDSCLYSSIAGRIKCHRMKTPWLF